MEPEEVGWSSSEIKVLCVPACSTTSWGVLASNEKWAGVCLAVANGDYRDASFVKGNRFQEMTLQNDRQYGCQRNQILLSRRLSEI
jgi:hypothetical protein